MHRRGPADYRVMPWKNGGGATTELLIEPPGATLQGGFRWRLSMAEVAASGPFSRFPGVDRSLMLLACGGMELDHGEHGRQRLERPLAPVRFPGEWPTEGTLLAGPCRDFNVMTARAEATHTLEVVALGPRPVALAGAPVLILVGLAGTARVAGERLGEGELLTWEGPEDFLGLAEGDGAAVALVRIHEHAGRG